jgi:hypothetical protein
MAGLVMHAWLKVRAGHGSLELLNGISGLDLVICAQVTFLAQDIEPHLRHSTATNPPFSAAAEGLSKQNEWLRPAAHEGNWAGV